MADPTAPDTTPQADTGTGADNGSQGALQGGNVPAQGDTPNPNSQDTPDGGTPPDGGDKGGDPNAKPGDDGKGGDKDGDKKPEGPKADVQNAAEYGLEGDDNLTKAFADQAFQLGFSKEQAQNLKGWWDGLREQAETIAKDDAAKAVVLLKKDWGDSYDANMSAANKAISTFGSPELVAELERTGFGRNPHMVKFVHNLAKLLSEDSFVTGATGGGSTNASAADVLYPNKK
ncbi:MAG: hypothetical protein FD177_223 [Desulfovibrionaceae bacterium]|nr:MAG: hypothetical protein FD177_223 [Desulfovibrionaceae bacterium]